MENQLSHGGLCGSPGHSPRCGSAIVGEKRDCVTSAYEKKLFERRANSTKKLSKALTNRGLESADAAFLGAAR